MLERVRAWYTAYGLFDRPAPPRPVIAAAEVRKKKLIVTGSGFEAGAVVLVEGEALETRNDAERPESELVARRGKRRIPRGTPVVLTVQNPDGAASSEFLFTRP